MTTLETGDIHFLFRPTVDETAPSGLPDVRNFVMVLAPRSEQRRRLVTVGKKRLPDTEQDERLWGYVAAVYDAPEALAEELGEH
ncbi:MAG: hypothetical protein LC789_18090, partial [Actinobacteria bacterium]|nr:hypothetical protein [Actinomycetota bacterium]